MVLPLTTETPYNTGDDMPSGTTVTYTLTFPDDSAFLENVVAALVTMTGVVNWNGPDQDTVNAFVEAARVMVANFDPL